MTNSTVFIVQKHSAVIEIFTSPWYEPGYQATALMFGIHYSVIPHPSMENVYDCIFPAHCMDPTIPISAYPDEYQSYMQENTTLMVHRRSLGCFGKKYCLSEIIVGKYYYSPNGGITSKVCDYAIAKLI
jgi:hypothetical protein